MHAYIHTLHCIYSYYYSPTTTHSSGSAARRAWRWSGALSTSRPTSRTDTVRTIKALFLSFIFDYFRWCNVLYIYIYIYIYTVCIII